jgi:hypothetical protein
MERFRPLHTLPFSPGVFESLGPPMAMVRVSHATMKAFMVQFF